MYPRLGRKSQNLRQKEEKTKAIQESEESGQKGGEM
jgi:hypothetical protein